jgi:hypothetical protein
VRGVTQEQIPDLHFNYPDTVRVYQEKPQYQTLKDGDVLMTLKQVLIPNQAGQIHLPGLSLDWWDTQQKQQRKSRLTGLTMVAAKAAHNDTLMSLPQGPTKPVPAAKIVYQKDAGIWPYLTAGVGVLWLITLLLWLISRHKNRSFDRQPVPTPCEPSTPELSLQDAIKQRDGIRIQHLIKQQLDTCDVSAEDRQAIAAELDKLQSSIYASSGQEDYDPKQLMQLLSKITKTSRKREKQQKDQLPDL